MEKRSLIFILLLICILFFVSCCSSQEANVYSVTFCVQNSNNSAKSMSYKTLNGNRTYNWDLKAGDRIEVNTTTTDGSIDLTILTKEGSEIYQGHDLGTTRFVISINQTSKYVFVVNAFKHSGSFSFNKMETN